MKTKILLFVPFCLLILFAQAQIKQVTTSADKTLLLSPKSLVTQEQATTSVTIEPDKSFQSIKGWGYALTGGSAKLLMQLSKQERTALFSHLFTNQGIGVNYLRISIGASDLDEKVQSAALKIAAGINLVGVMAVEIFIVGDKFYINELALRPHNSGHWTIEGSKTSQFEQHLRAVLDLPLGSTALTNKFAVMGNILGGEKTDMYRPYLHLMARTPELHFHQYRKEVRPGRKIGHVTLCGDNLLELKDEVQHAIDYMSGVVDE